MGRASSAQAARAAAPERPGPGPSGLTGTRGSAGSRAPPAPSPSPTGTPAAPRAGIHSDQDPPELPGGHSPGLAPASSLFPLMMERTTDRPERRSPGAQTEAQTEGWPPEAPLCPPGRVPGAPRQTWAPLLQGGGQGGQVGREGPTAGSGVLGQASPGAGPTPAVPGQVHRQYGQPGHGRSLYWTLVSTRRTFNHGDGPEATRLTPSPQPSPHNTPSSCPEGNLV